MEGTKMGGDKYIHQTFASKTPLAAFIFILCLIIFAVLLFTKVVVPLSQGNLKLEWWQWILGVYTFLILMFLLYKFFFARKPKKQSKH